MCNTTPPVSTQPSGHNTPVPEQPPFNPFVHPLLVPQFNPLYLWPWTFLNLHLMQNPFAYFPIIPHLQVCPFHAAAWYYSQQSMGTPLCPQPMSFGIPPSVTPQSPMAQSTTTGTGTGTLITNNFVTFNEIGNDNSTNLRIQKNRTLFSCCYAMDMRSWVFILGHHNTGSG